MKSLKPDTFYSYQNHSYIYVYRMLDKTRVRCYLRISKIHGEIVKRDFLHPIENPLLLNFVEFSKKELIQLIGPKTKQTEEIYKLIAASLSDTISKVITKLEKQYVNLE